MKKRVIIIVALIVIVIVVLGLGFLFENKTQSVLIDSSYQVQALNGIYEDFLSGFNMEEDNIVLDTSAVSNFVTGESFSEDEIETLKEYEKSLEDANETFILSITYNEESSILTVTIESELQISRQDYSISDDGKSIGYERYGLGTTLNM